jgi:hypothetical protein
VIGDREMRFLLTFENRLEIRFQMVIWRLFFSRLVYKGICDSAVDASTSVVRICDAKLASMYYSSRDIYNLTAIYLSKCP